MVKKVKLTDTDITFFFSSGKELTYAINLLPVKNTEPLPTGWAEKCKRCGACCYYRWLDRDGKVKLTDEACKFLDKKTKTCSIYSSREITPGGCAQMSPNRLVAGLPETCAYLQDD